VKQSVSWIHYASKWEQQERERERLKYNFHADVENIPPILYQVSFQYDLKRKFEKIYIYTEIISPISHQFKSPLLTM
jgi:hypothetical protein